MGTTSSSSQPLPIPTDFPLAWETPDQAQAFWTHERMHWPGQIPRLEEMVLEAVDHAFNTAAMTYEMPIRFSTKRFNSYVYQAIIPLLLPPAELEAMGGRAEAKLQQAVAQLGERWSQEWLPEIQQMLRFWEATDLARMPLPALATHLDETLMRFKRALDIHFEIAIPMILSMGLFDDVYRDLFGNEAGFGAQRLLQGLPNKSLEADHALWQLSRRALAKPSVKQVLEEQAASVVMTSLAKTAEGQSFLIDFQVFLAEYGQRGLDFLNISKPSWLEDPTPAINNLKDFIGQPDRDLVAEMASRANEREAGLATCRAQLIGYPAPVVGQFEGLLSAAQVATQLQEDHNFWIDQRVFYHMRQVLVECGRRLVAAGSLIGVEDIFHLTIAEVVASLATPSINYHQPVAQRQAEMARFAARPAPPMLGTLPPGPPPDSPIARAIGKFFGGPPQPSTEPGLLKGNAGSPGRVRGQARVIRSLDAAGQLRRGEILVTETTSPPWTPLFATAAAVVTDTGGILSHCAVVAREYCIPAVVGVGSATAVVQDGQWLEVDGDAGTLRLIAQP